MERGQELYVGGNLEAAAEVFDTSYEKYRFPAFLFNAGLCHQKLGRIEEATQRFQAYLSANPTAPDADRVRARIAALEAAAQASQPTPPTAETGPGDASTETGTGEGEAVPAAPSPTSAGVAEQPDSDVMKSVVLVETEPSGAPVILYAPRSDSARQFVLGANNPDWVEVAAMRAPANLTLDVGRYQVVVGKYRDFNTATQQIEVTPGRVLQFVANLSQGTFMSFLRVSANVRGAYVYLDDADKRKPEWGFAPHSELVSAGKHSLLVEAPGFEPYFAEFELKQGEQRFVEVKLSRVGYGILRIDADAPEVSVKVEEVPVGIWRSGQPPLQVKLAAGPKQIEVSGKGRKTFRGTVDIPQGQALPVHAEMIPTYPRGAAWTQAAIGTAFVGTSVWLGVESNRLHSELEQDRRAGVLDQADKRILRGKLFAIGADAGFAVGGVLGILATYNFIRDPLPESNLDVNSPVEFDAPVPEAPRSRETPPSVGKATSRRSRRVPIVVGANASEFGGCLLLGGRF